MVPLEAFTPETMTHGTCVAIIFPEKSNAPVSPKIKLFAENAHQVSAGIDTPVYHDIITCIRPIWYSLHGVCWMIISTCKNTLLSDSTPIFTGSEPLQIVPTRKHCPYFQAIELEICSYKWLILDYAWF